MKKLTPVLIILFSAMAPCIIYAQEDFEKWSSTPKTTQAFAADYKISRPRLEYPNWDKDYDLYYNFLTPALRKTQASFSFKNEGVTTLVVPNSIMHHAQLDTATIMADEEQLKGTWRMIKFRSIRFVDSVNLPSKTYYRLPDTILDDKSADEAFAVIADKTFKLYVKEQGKSEFKKMMSSKYKVENKRYIMLYRLAKSAAGVSQFGMDEKGYLIMNYPQVIEHTKAGDYYAYYTIIEQYIFEKVNP